MRDILEKGEALHNLGSSVNKCQFAKERRATRELFCSQGQPPNLWMCGKGGVIRGEW